MTVRTFALSILLIGLLAGRDRKTVGPGQAENEKIAITATAYSDKDSVKQLLGWDLGGYFIVLDVRVTPKGGKSLNLLRDDFTLRTDKDGQRSQPFQPSQIAGTGVLVVSEGGGSAPATMSDPNGPIYGGGPVPMGQPSRLPGNGGAMGGGSDVTSAQGNIKTEKNSKPNPLLQTLKQRVMPETETKEPVSGLLYFSLEGKNKLKDLELLYKGDAGKLSIRFH